MVGSRYELRGQLGSGGTATVWEALDTRLDRPVALKLLHADAANGLDDRLAEASAAAGLRSPHLVHVLDVGRDGGQAFVVMELVDGHTLRQLLDRHDRLPPDVVAALGSQVARALHVVHRSGMTHGDVKPGNILVAHPSGLVKLSDFGSATAPATQDEPTECGWTPRYVSPARLEGQPPTPSDDLYALGLLLWECVVGRPAFRGDTAVADAAARLVREPDPLAEVAPEAPAGLAAVVTALTRRQPEDRPAHALTVARQLEGLAGERPWGRTAAFVADDGHAAGTQPPPAGTGEPTLDEREERALRAATIAFTQAVTAAPDVAALARIAGGRPSVLARARQLLASVSLDEEHPHHRRAAELLGAAEHHDEPAEHTTGLPVDDADRLLVLDATGLLDSPVEEAFDRASRLASRLLGVPVALVSIVDADRQFFKSQVGLPEPWSSRRETPLTHSFCRYVAETDQTLSVVDAREHPLVADNAAIDDLSVISYLGVPLDDGQGTVLGSFCVIDARPRQWSPDDLAALEEIAAIVRREIRLRTTAQALARRAQDARDAMAMLGHDLRGPLGVITGGVETIRRLQAADVERLEQLLDAMARQADRTLAIADALLDAARPGTPAAPPVPLRRLVETLLTDDVLPAGAARRVRVTVPDDLRFPVDRTSLEQVIVNLVGNALEHTDGDVEVAASTLDEGQLEVRVRDEGRGLTPEELEHLSRPHVRGERSTGHGLGLAIVRRFVRQMGGQLRVEASPAGGGTTFVVTVPPPAAG